MLQKEIVSLCNLTHQKTMLEKVKYPSKSNTNILDALEEHGLVSQFAIVTKQTHC
jgi:hypothetical protein